MFLLTLIIQKYYFFFVLKIFVIVSHFFFFLIKLTYQYFHLAIIVSKNYSLDSKYHFIVLIFTKIPSKKHILLYKMYFINIRQYYSYLDTLFNMLKGNLGCGILAMGDAFKNGGLLLSPVLTFIIGSICVYNQHLLVRNYNKIKVEQKCSF